MYSERGRYVINIHISREISIEHPSVGLASLAQLYIYVTVPGKRDQVAHFFKIELLLLPGRVVMKAKCSGVIAVSVHSFLSTAIS